jgi:hypothetical protein
VVEDEEFYEIQRLQDINDDALLGKALHRVDPTLIHVDRFEQSIVDRPEY